MKYMVTTELLDKIAKQQADALLALTSHPDMHGVIEQYMTSTGIDINERSEQTSLVFDGKICYNFATMMMLTDEEAELVYIANDTATCIFDAITKYIEPIGEENELR